MKEQLEHKLERALSAFKAELKKEGLDFVAGPNFAPVPLGEASMSTTNGQLRAGLNFAVADFTERAAGLIFADLEVGEHFNWCDEEHVKLPSFKLYGLGERNCVQLVNSALGFAPPDTKVKRWAEPVRPKLDRFLIAACIEGLKEALFLAETNAISPEGIKDGIVAAIAKRQCELYEATQQAA